MAGPLTRLTDRLGNTTSHTDDALGRRLTMTDASGATTWTYDAGAGMPATVDGPFDDDTLAFTRDAAGRRLVTSLDGNPVATYNAGQLTGLYSPE